MVGETVGLAAGADCVVGFAEGDAVLMVVGVVGFAEGAAVLVTALQLLDIVTEIGAEGIPFATTVNVLLPNSIVLATSKNVYTDEEKSRTVMELWSWVRQ